MDVAVTVDGVLGVAPDYLRCVADHSLRSLEFDARASVRSEDGLKHGEVEHKVILSTRNQIQRLEREISSNIQLTFRIVIPFLSDVSATAAFSLPLPSDV